VEEHHALADGHGPGAPCEHGLASRQLGDAEEAQAVEERSDMATGDRDGLAVVDDVGELRAVLGDGGAVERLVASVEVLTVARASIEVERVDVADGVDRRARLVFEDVVGRGALIDDVLRVERVLEANAVEVLAVTEQRLPLAMMLRTGSITSSSCASKNGRIAA
jgi:hypothetical protein